MWVPLFNDFFEDCEWWKVFISLGTISQIFGPKWESDSVPCKTVWTDREEKVDLLLMLYTVMLFSLKHSLTSFGDKPLTNFYSSVARTCIFLWCTDTELSISKRSVKEDVLSLHIIRIHLSRNLFILLLNVRLWNIHDNGQ